MKTAIVVGSGVSGIAAAMRLLEHGVEPRVFEREPFVGGRIGTRPHDGTEVDLGGRNFASDDGNLVRLLGSFGVTEFVDYEFNSVAVGTNSRFDVRRTGTGWEKLIRLLGNLMVASPSAIRKLRRVVNEAVGTPGGMLIASPYWSRLAEATEDSTATAYFGAALADAALRPTTLRMMASEPEEVYLGNLAPLLGKKRRTMKRVASGMGTFLRAARERLDVSVSHRVESVLIDERGAFGVEGTRTTGESFREEADVVVLSTPASVAAELLRAVPRLRELLLSIVYRPVATIVARYEDVQFPNRVDGIFLPRRSAANHIARYDKESRVRFTFAGVAARRAIGAATSLEELLRIGEANFHSFGGRLTGRADMIGQVWSPGLCGHTRMHHRTRQAILELGRDVHGLVLTGDYFRGNLLECCVTAAEENVDERLGSRPGVTHRRPEPLRRGTDWPR